MGSEQSTIQPEFLKALKRLIMGPKEPVAPDSLVRGIFDRLEKDCPTACESGPLKVLSEDPLCTRQDPDRSAEVSTLMEVLSALSNYANRPEGSGPSDPLLRLIEAEHEQLQAGGCVILAEGEGLTALQNAIKAKVPDFNGIPSFAHRQLGPMRCGLLDFEDFTGFFIEYRSCKPSCTWNRLITIKSDRTPTASAIHFREKTYYLQTSGRHTLVAWPAAVPGWLQILVTECPSKNSLAFAELLRTQPLLQENKTA